MAHGVNHFPDADVAYADGMDDEESVRRRLSDEMNAQKLTRTKLAKRLGRNQNWISRRVNETTEADIVELTITDAAEIARGLGYDLTVSLVPIGEQGEPAKLLAGLTPEDLKLVLRLARTIRRGAFTDQGRDLLAILTVKGD